MSAVSRLSAWGLAALVASISTACFLSESEPRCAAKTTCGQCTESGSGCGWCTGTGQCLAGTALGPTVSSCDTSWKFDECPDEWTSERCHIYASCGSCLVDSNCGWCDGRCLSAADEAWKTCKSWMPPKTPTASCCEISTTREACDLTLGCTWCGTRSKCLSRDAEADCCAGASSDTACSDASGCIWCRKKNVCVSYRAYDSFSCL